MHGIKSFSDKVMSDELARS